MDPSNDRSCWGTWPKLVMSKKATPSLKAIDERALIMVPSWDQAILGSIRGLTDEQKRRVEEKLSPVCSLYIGRCMLLLLLSCYCECYDIREGASRTESSRSAVDYGNSFRTTAQGQWSLQDHYSWLWLHQRSRLLHLLPNQFTCRRAVQFPRRRRRLKLLQNQFRCRRAVQFPNQNSWPWLHQSRRLQLLQNQFHQRRPVLWANQDSWLWLHRRGRTRTAGTRGSTDCSSCTSSAAESQCSGRTRTAGTAGVVDCSPCTSSAAEGQGFGRTRTAGTRGSTAEVVSSEASAAWFAQCNCARFFCDRAAELVEQSSLQWQGRGLVRQQGLGRPEMSGTHPLRTMGTHGAGLRQQMGLWRRLSGR